MEDPLDELSARLRSLEERMGRIEVSQKEILVRDEKIRATIEEVRVWSHRNPRL